MEEREGGVPPPVSIGNLGLSPIGKYAVWVDLSSRYLTLTLTLALNVLTLALLFLSFLSYILVCFRCLCDEIKMYI